jgi:D-glycero-alpha-D-manno-heptose 1-phosphate guanylyltransferase
MQVIPVILAGGIGSRLASVLADLPKPLAPIGDRPFITYLFDCLLDAGFDRVVIATGYRGEKFPEVLGHSYKTLKLYYSREVEPLGTGGAVRLALELAGDECQQILVMNGDSLVDMDIGDFINWARNYPEALALVRVADCFRYASVIIDDAFKVLDFQEKSVAPCHGWINTGIYLFSRELVVSWSASRKFSMEYDCLPKLVDRGRLYGFPVTAPFIDIGIPETYFQAETFLQQLDGRSATRD